MVYAARTILLASNQHVGEMCEELLEGWGNSVQAISPVGDLVVIPVEGIKPVEQLADPDWRVIFAYQHIPGIDGPDWELGRALAYIDQRVSLGTPDRLMAGIVKVDGATCSLWNFYPVFLDDSVPPRHLIRVDCIAQSPESDLPLPAIGDWDLSKLRL